MQLVQLLPEDGQYILNIILRQHLVFPCLKITVDIDFMSVLCQKKDIFLFAVHYNGSLFIYNTQLFAEYHQVNEKKYHFFYQDV